ncbi:MAG: 2-(1,2-epoxy,2-dihydrophenyl)acetyl-CoA isomerase [Acidimicrobiaceae bacterium]
MTDSTFDKLDGDVARFTIDRPTRLGAYTPALCSELLSAITAYAHDDELRCLILTGTGRGFCTGGDVSPDAGFDLNGQVARARDLRTNAHAVVLALYHLDKPVVCAINGFAVNGGLAFALCADIRVAAASARLGDTSARTGLLPDEGGAWLFPRVLGQERAYRMVALSELYSADEALLRGLISEVVEDDRLQDRAVEIARSLAAGPPLALRAVKTMMRRAAMSTLESSLVDAQQAVLWVGPSEDAQEGKAAFLAKRPARFQGR